MKCYTCKGKGFMWLYTGNGEYTKVFCTICKGKGHFKSKGKK